MKVASISELKQQLQQSSNTELINLCLRLTRYKKDNKELLTYLLFESDNVDQYVKHINDKIVEDFNDINKSNIYFVKKSIRKIVKTTSKYIRYASNEIVEIEVLIFLCKKITEMGTVINNNTIINNIYKAQLKKIEKSIASMHEDLQYDYLKKLDLIIGM